VGSDSSIGDRRRRKKRLKPKKNSKNFLFYFYFYFFHCLGGCNTTVGSDGSAGDPSPLKKKS
jgi:hypothetical protein